MIEEELLFFKELLEDYSKDIIVEETIMLEDCQYLLGTYEDNYFTFGTFNSADGIQFFLQEYDVDFTDFVRLTQIISDILGEKPAEFIEEKDREFIWYWATESQKAFVRDYNANKKAKLKVKLRQYFNIPESNTNYLN